MVAFLLSMGIVLNSLSIIWLSTKVEFKPRTKKEK